MITDEAEDGAPAASPESLGGVVSAIMATYRDSREAMDRRAMTYFGSGVADER
jgi:hypothetical protein